MRKNKLTNEQIDAAYKEIKEACTHTFKTKSNKVDFKKNYSIYEKYFNKTDSLLNINDPIPGTGWTPIMAVSWFNYEEDIKKLISLGADVTIKNEIVKDKGSTPHSSFHLHINNGNEGLCLSLLKSNPTLANAKTEGGQTPLMIACERGLSKLVKTLIETYNVDIKEKDNNNKTCIDYCDLGKHEYIKKIIQHYDLDKKLAHNDTKKKVVKI